jgi:hypothetical protein
MRRVRRLRSIRLGDFWEICGRGRWRLRLAGNRDRVGCRFVWHGVPLKWREPGCNPALSMAQPRSRHLVLIEQRSCRSRLSTGDVVSDCDPAPGTGTFEIRKKMGRIYATDSWAVQIIQDSGGEACALNGESRILDIALCLNVGWPGGTLSVQNACSHAERWNKEKHDLLRIRPGCHVSRRDAERPKRVFPRRALEQGKA